MWLKFNARSADRRVRVLPNPRDAHSRTKLSALLPTIARSKDMNIGDRTERSERKVLPRFVSLVAF